MIDLEKTVSSFVANQFPEFYHTDGPVFVAFVKAYYEWMESPDGPLYHSRRLPEYTDIDNTIELFSQSLKNTYMASLPSTSKADRAFSIKHIQDLYKTKGTTESEKLLFRLIFNTDVEIYKPADDILRPSAGVWTIPKYIEVASGSKAVSFIGKKITGSITGATGIVESVARRTINSRVFDVIYLSSVVGKFEVDEVVSTDGDLVDAPRIIGSLSSITITDGGQDLEVGELFDIDGVHGKYGSARVSATVDGTGAVSFELLDGGNGYSNAHTVLTFSNTVIFHNGSNNGSYNIGETVDQKLYLLTANGTSFSVNTAVTAANTTANTANGVVLSSNATSILVSAHTGAWTGATKIINESNTASNTVISLVTDQSRSAVVMQSNTVANGLKTLSNTVVQSAYVRGRESNTISRAVSVSTGSGASFTLGALQIQETANVWNTDTLGGINAYGVPYLNMKLDGSNSNGTGYGFSGNNTIGYTNFIANAFAYALLPLGKFTSIGNINPGVGYNAPPMISIRDSWVAPYQKYNRILTLNTVTGSFVTGQTANTASNATNLIVSSTSNQVTVRPLTFVGQLDIGDTVTAYYSNGAVSGTGVIANIQDDRASKPMGWNAVVDDTVVSFTGIAAQVDLLDSGYGYVDDEVITLTSQSNSAVVLTGTATVLNHGKSVGYWETNAGKLNSDKYLQDSDYYQAFSYEVQTDMSIDKYADILKKVFHMAGTKMFGKVVKNSAIDVRLSSSGIEVGDAVFSPTSDSTAYFSDSTILTADIT